MPDHSAWILMQMVQGPAASPVTCFSNEDLKKLQEGHLEVAGKCQHLVKSYLRRDYKNRHAQEYAVHGFSRRLKTLARCIDNVFRILPPDRIELPSSGEIADAMINIQAFVFNFRHALAHRIPLYIPPYKIPTDKEATYQQLEAAKWDAIKEGDFAEHDRLKGEQEEMAKFVPVMTHSFKENSRAVFFHPQLLCDFLTVEEVAKKTAQGARSVI